MRQKNIQKSTCGILTKYFVSLTKKPQEYNPSNTKHNANQTSFAFLMTFIYMISFFTYVDDDIKLYTWLLAIKGIGTVLCVGLFLEYYWPDRLKQISKLYWNFTLLYCLPFSFTLFFLINKYNIEWIISIALAITLLIVLVDWITFVILTCIGIVLALLVYRAFIGPFPVLDTDNLLLLVYSTTFTIAIGLIFVRKKEQNVDMLIMHNQQLAKSQQRYREELAESLRYREQILQELKPNEISAFDQTTAGYIQQALYRMIDYLRLEVTCISIHELEKAIAELYKLQASDQDQLLFKTSSVHKEFQGDFVQIKQLILNAIRYIQKNNTNHNPIIIAIEDAVLGHDIKHMPNYTRKLEALKISISTTMDLPITQPIYKIDLTKPSTWVAKEEDEFLLIENARIIDAHYGYMAEKSVNTQVYILPVKLREIRGKVMELIKEPSAADPQELNHPLAIQLEKELMEKLQNTQVDIKLIKKALDIIKKYHAGVKRKSGEPFFTHPIAVALILLEYSQDQDAILGALLHDTVEDTSLSFEHIRMLFGTTVEFLVAKATNLEDHKRRISLSDKENIVRILNYEDPRAALVKLSDRLHNMRTIKFHSCIKKQKYIAQETLDYFVPLARKIGIEKMAIELEQLSQEVMDKRDQAQN